MKVTTLCIFSIAIVHSLNQMEQIKALTLLLEKCFIKSFYRKSKYVYVLLINSYAIVICGNDGGNLMLLLLQFFAKFP